MNWSNTTGKKVRGGDREKETKPGREEKDAERAEAQPELTGTRHTTRTDVELEKVSLLENQGGQHRREQQVRSAVYDLLRNPEFLLVI